MFYIIGIGQNVDIYSIGDENRTKFFKANFNPLKINTSLSFFGSSWAKLTVVYVKKKQAKKLNFAPKIALRTECSDTAQIPYFSADFLSARFYAVGFSTNVEKFLQLNV
jgi:hypothetical protein